MQEKAESVVFPASPSVSESRGGCEPFTRAHLLHVLPFETLWLLCCCKEPPSDLCQRQHALRHAGGIAPMKFHRLANILRCESHVCNDDVYLDGFRWYSWIGSLLQIGRQVLINVLKDQGEFGFSVGPRDRAHIKQPGNRGTYMREWVILNDKPHLQHWCSSWKSMLWWCRCFRRKCLQTQIITCCSSRWCYTRESRAAPSTQSPEQQRLHVSH